MPSIQVRPAANTDLPALSALDHGYSTDYVWQMTAREEEAAGETVITFRTARLPRSVRVSPPREPNRLAEAWKGKREALEARAIEKPVFVVGTPRSGSSASWTSARTRSRSTAR